jgi:hypothetical protein
MPAATQKKAPITLLDGEFLKDLCDVAEKLEAVAICLEDLSADDRFEHRRTTDDELSWLLQGWTSDLLLDVQEIVRSVLGIRSHVMAGLTDDELALLYAAGGKH